MSRYSHITAIPLSLFSRSLYQDVAQNWRGIGLRYLLLLTLLTCIPLSYVMNKAAVRFIDEKMPGLVMQIPAITITDGILSTEKKQPYFIKDPASGKLLAIIDTSGHYRTAENTQALVVISENQLSYRTTEQQLASHSLKNLTENYHIDQAVINQKLTFIKQYFWVIFSVASTVLYFIIHFFQTVLCTLAGLVIANAQKVIMNFSQLMRLAAVAITPALIISALFAIIGFNFPYQGMVKVLIAIIYMYFAVSANTQYRRNVLSC